MNKMMKFPADEIGEDFFYEEIGNPRDYSFGWSVLLVIRLPFRRFLQSISLLPSCEGILRTGESTVHLRLVLGR